MAGFLKLEWQIRADWRKSFRPIDMGRVTVL